MPTRDSHVVLIWPVALPGTGELRAEIDAAEDGVELVREDDGALVISRGADALRIERPAIESAEAIDGDSFRRSHTGVEEVLLEREADVVVLYRPVGNVELGLVAASGWSVFPPRLPEQPIFYPVTNLAYAREIAERWNAAEGRGIHVLRGRPSSHRAVGPGGRARGIQRRDRRPDRGSGPRVGRTSSRVLTSK